MKRVYTILFVILLMSFIPDTIMAGNHSTYTTTVYKAKKQSEHNQNIDDEGRRTPPVPLTCSISNITGLNIGGYSEDIITFEIWDISNECCLASFDEESVFVNYLLSQIGDFQIRLETEYYYIYGDITIE